MLLWTHMYNFQVQFSRSVVSDSLRPHGLWHTKLPCSSPTPRAYSNSCPLSQWCHPTICHLLLLLSSIFPNIRVFSNESVLHLRWPKHWSFSFISPSSEYSGLISFRMDWLDLLAVQGILKSLLQQHSSKASILLHSAFFMVQLSHPNMTAATAAAAKSLQSRPTLSDPMNRSMPSLPVHRQLLEFTQTHVHWWCHPTISSSVIPFSSCPQSFTASGSFPMSQIFTSGGQSIGISALASVLPMNTQDWSLRWTGWISLQSKGLSRVFSNTTVQKHQFFSTQLSL